MQSANGQVGGGSPLVNFVVQAASPAPAPGRPPVGEVPDSSKSILVAMGSEKAAYHIGEPIRFGLSVKTHAQGLNITVGPGKEKLWITQNGAIIWQTEDGITGTNMMHTWKQPAGVATVSLNRNEPLFFEYTWDGHIKDSQGNVSLPMAGKYELNGRIDYITALPTTITESRINKAMLSGDGYFRIADESL